MKTLSGKKSIFVLLTLFVFSVVVFVFVQIENSTNSDKQIEQTLVATVFAPSNNPPPVVELKSAQATKNTLTIVLSVSGLEIVKTPDDFENIVCNPYIRNKEQIQLTLNYREGDIPDRIGEPLIITYEYDIDAREHQSLNIEMDFTIGPCGQSFTESSVTPYPPVDLIANYQLAFSVPVK